MSTRPLFESCGLLPFGLGATPAGSALLDTTCVARVDITADNADAFAKGVASVDGAAFCGTGTEWDGTRCVATLPPAHTHCVHAEVERGLDHSLLQDPVRIDSAAFETIVSEAAASCKASGGSYVDVWNNGQFQCRGADECSGEAPDAPAKPEPPMTFRLP